MIAACVGLVAGSLTVSEPWVGAFKVYGSGVGVWWGGGMIVAGGGGGLDVVVDGGRYIPHHYITLNYLTPLRSLPHHYLTLNDCSRRVAAVSA